MKVEVLLLSIFGMRAGEWRLYKTNKFLLMDFMRHMRK